MNLIRHLIHLYRGIYPYSMPVLSTGREVGMESQSGFIAMINEATSRYQLVMLYSDPECKFQKFCDPKEVEVLMKRFC